MKLTPSQVQAFASLAFKYTDAGQSATISRGDGRAVIVTFGGGDKYTIGGRGTVTQV